MSDETTQSTARSRCCGGGGKPEQKQDSALNGGIRISTKIGKDSLNSMEESTKSRLRCKAKPPPSMEAKVILLGNSGVGKSSIAQRYCRDQFTESHDVTIGGAYMQQTVKLPYGTSVKMHIWDTGGSERFRTMVSLYYKDAAAAIICFDLTDEDSFTGVNYWIDEMVEKNNSDEFVMALAGNKCDCPDRQVAESTIETIVDHNRMIYKETSAKTGEGVSDVFQKVADQIVRLTYAVPEEKGTKN